MSKKAKRSLCLLFLLFLLFTNTLSLSAYAKESSPDLSRAEHVYLYNFESNRVLIEKNSDEKLFPASMTKVVTALVALESLADRLDEKVVITNELLSGHEGAGMKLEAGMTVTVMDLLYGLICGGGNDAALVLSRICEKDTATFVSRMNKFAISLGATNTTFTNPTGLDDEAMYSTLSDIALFCHAAADSPLYMEISNAKSYVYSPYSSGEKIKLFNRNALVGTYYAQGYVNRSADGIMSGVTDLGGYCVAALGNTGTEKYLCIVMGATADKNNIYSYKLFNELLNYASARYEYKCIAKEGDIISSIPVENAEKYSENGDGEARISCALGEDVYVLLDNHSNEQIRYKCYFFEDTVSAPCPLYQKVGGVDYICGDRLMATVPLVLTEDVKANGFLLLMDNLKNFFLGKFFIISLITFLLIFSLYYYFIELRHRRKKTKKIKYRNFY
ncbi:MAG: D-alanyl-D-alanine carboxypeptidase [Clostridia bacterium]|nr:D-alanyl-D-alanine carboxypeptidase [Clostridia bacterium]